MEIEEVVALGKMLLPVVAGVREDDAKMCGGIGMQALEGCVEFVVGP